MNAYFAGGCFWCITPIFKMYGVKEVICGYGGGDEENPTYEQVKKQLDRLNDTVFTLDTLEFEESNAFIPAKLLNNARREIVQGL